jgi:integrase
MLATVVDRANEDVNLPAITPHSLRRTFASILYAIGEPPPVVMAEIGHTDPKLALAIYAQAMRRDNGENERLRSLVGTQPISLERRESGRMSEDTEALTLATR